MHSRRQVIRFIGCQDLLPVVFPLGRLPPYAIVSHTWFSANEEVSISDLISGSAKRKKGFEKLFFCAKKALSEGVLYIWMDTCCIDFSSELERSEAVKQMFNWYQNAKFCYVFLSDISHRHLDQRQDVKGSWKIRSLAESEWFKRGWTLMELLAPGVVKFFSLEGTWLGNKDSLKEQISEITSIPQEALGSERFQVDDWDVTRKLRWAEGRHTTRPEDEAYCLLGLLGVSMELHYGEGKNRAMDRLKSELDRAGLYRMQSNGTGLVRYNDIGDDVFRVLVIEPGAEGDPIVTSFEERKLKSPGKYFALSYTWGSGSPRFEIRIGENSCLVRPNLYSALQRVRSSAETTYLWVDSLCINQGDNDEKAKQVQEMFRIFTQAEDVWIWLGEQERRSHRAMAIIPKLADKSFEWPESWWCDQDLIAFDRLLHRPFFKRVWVVQEVAAAENPMIHVGGDKISMTDFAAAVRHVQEQIRSQRLIYDLHTSGKASRSPLSGFETSGAVQLLDMLDKIFIRSSNNEKRQKRFYLEELVNSCTSSEMTDLRDAIYALLSLTKESDVALNMITTDYGQPTLDVFAEYIASCARSFGSLDVLCRPWAPELDPSADADTLLQAFPVNDLAYPSWICTRSSLPFGNPSDNLGFRVHHGSLVGPCRRRQYNAHNGSSPKFEIGRGSDGRCDGSLSVTGLILGSIKSRSPPMPQALISHKSLKLKVPSKKGVKYTTCVGLCRLLCADIDQIGKPATNAVCAAFKQAWNLSWEAQGDLENRASSPDEAPNSMDVEEILSQPSLDKDLKAYLEVVRNTIWNRRTFEGRTLDGTHIVGLVPQEAKITDKICILHGLSVPVVLRAAESSTAGMEQWTLIGEAYVHDYMNGEAFDLPAMGLYNAEQSFLLR